MISTFFFNKLHLKTFFALLLWFSYMKMMMMMLSGFGSVYMHTFLWHSIKLSEKREELLLFIACDVLPFRVRISSTLPLKLYFTLHCAEAAGIRSSSNGSCSDQSD